MVLEMQWSARNRKAIKRRPRIQRVLGHSPDRRRCARVSGRQTQRRSPQSFCQPPSIPKQALPEHESPSNVVCHGGSLDHSRCSVSILPAWFDTSASDGNGKGARSEGFRRQGGRKYTTFCGMPLPHQCSGPGDGSSGRLTGHECFSAIDGRCQAWMLFVLTSSPHIHTARERLFSSIAPKNGVLLTSI